MHTVDQIANYFLSLSDPEIGDGISNLKLQKLCYYAQGFYLAQHDTPIFDDTIEAWQHGPVVPTLYHKYKSEGNNFIPHKEINLDEYSGEIKQFLNEVYNVYGQFSAWKLRDMTHNEAPWTDTCNSNNKIISHESMKNYFKKLIDV